jgi:hypothetical protein
MPPDEPKAPFRFRKLRIAWSVFWGLACVLLIVLWVRSCWNADAIAFYESNADYVDVGIDHGTFALNTGLSLPKRIRLIRVERYHTVSGASFGFYFAHDHGQMVHFKVPLAALLMVVAFLASASWFRWHFRLRTLLIATTLVAVALGVVVSLAGR